MKKTIYYWSPCLTKIATVKATLNSAISLAKYSNLYEVKIINVCGEWNKYKKYLLENNVSLENLSFDYYNLLPKDGFIKYRVSIFLIFLVSLVPLIFLIKNKKPDYFIIHMITSLPLILFNFLSLKTKTILRISGSPKLNFLRKKLWMLSEKKLFMITCPTDDLRKYLIKVGVFSKNKVIKLYDPVINVKEFVKKKFNKIYRIKDKENNTFFVAAGRLTKQKNFIYLIREFGKFCNIYPKEKLLIFGEGELKNRIFNEIDKNSLSQNIKLLGYTDNIYKYMLKSKAFILSSLWEDPGFVIIESALCNSMIISSNCKNGPNEFLSNGNAGLLFENNKENELFKKLKEFKELKKNEIYEKKILAKKKSMEFTMFRHYLGLRNIIERT
ncbi:glycosyltransferase [Candidatus Pelagibacter sp.]|nr:glycosyltransferase [Candidatus Pelagibacter sp.]